jgi:hypothetical protein
LIILVLSTLVERKGGESNTKSDKERPGWREGRKIETPKIHYSGTQKGERIP